MTQPFDSVILVAHGARDARWTEPFFRIRAELEQEARPRRVLLAFMEFAPPSFADCTRDLHAEGGRVVLVAPIFLSGGGHVSKDIPVLVAPERLRYPDMTFVVSGAIGEEPEVKQGMLLAVARLARAIG